MRNFISILLVSCLILETPVLILADTTPSNSANASTEAANRFCFRGRPLPECRYFMVTEFSYFRRLNTKPQGSAHESGKWYLTGDFGLMVNINESWSVGGILFFGGDDDSGRGGIGPRFRKWFAGEGGKPSATRLDITAGPLLWISDNYLGPHEPGFMANVSLNMHDWFAITGQLEIIRYDIFRYMHDPPFTVTHDSENDVAIYIGAKGASYGAFIGFGVFFLLYAISAASDPSW